MKFRKSNDRIEKKITNLVFIWFENIWKEENPGLIKEFLTKLTRRISNMQTTTETFVRIVFMKINLNVEF